jgi:hypothetical protein
VAVDAAVRVDLLDRQVERLLELLAVGGVLPGLRRGDAEGDGALGARRRLAARSRGRERAAGAGAEAHGDDDGGGRREGDPGTVLHGGALPAGVRATENGR